MNHENVQATKHRAEAKISRFKFAKLLNQDQAGRRVSLLGSIDDAPAILLVERAAFSDQEEHLDSMVQSISRVQNLGSNDIYSWFLANQTLSSNSEDIQSKETSIPADLKLNIIHPCTEKHIAKYSSQAFRIVHETPKIYKLHIRPYIEQQRLEGRLNWVFNIIEGRTEQEDVIYREGSCTHAHGEEDALSMGGDGFLLLPDLNWDRKTLTSLHLLAIVERRDIWSLRDLRKCHLQWLRNMQQKVTAATIELYPELERDQLKLYLHYQPTYYHFHIHVVHVMLESGATQAVGKALGLDNIMAWLESMDDPQDLGMSGVDLIYHLGEESDLWIKVFRPLKDKIQPVDET